MLIKHPGAIKKIENKYSSSVVLYRTTGNRGGEIEVFLGQRRPDLKNFPDMLAGIGGKVESSDYQAANDLRALSKYETVAELVFKTCAWRELIEEVGIVCYDDSSGEIVKKVRAYAQGKPILDMGRLIDDCALDPTGLLLGHLLKAGLRTTPEFSQNIFSTQFFLLSLPRGQQPSISPGHSEFSQGIWGTPEYFIKEFRNLRLRIPPPVLGLLKALREQAKISLGPDGISAPFQALERLCSDDTLPLGLQIPIEVSPGIQAIPFRSRTLAPATTTNLVVIGDQHELLIDPGANTSNEVDRLIQIVGHWVEKKKPQTILVTHEHQDHWEAALILRERFDIPITLAQETQMALVDRIQADIVLPSNHVFDLGVDSVSGKRWTVRLMHMPGHSPGHVVLYDERFGVLICGDVITGIGTVVINDYREYMRTLQHFQTMEVSTILPGHGPVLYEGKETIIRYIDHRKTRERQILDSMSTSEASTA
ncbi:MAG TPA: MBL fold metallo-hydrolase, partial [Candidatus Hodarchaeales archaeon]|nr:MBL fold metallo-hydrolase [Candidatus Hodarchaeales archaeon]